MVLQNIKFIIIPICLKAACFIILLFCQTFSLYVIMFCRESCREKSCFKSRVLCILWPANASGNVWESFIRTCP